MRVIIASKNKKKRSELQEILGLQFEVLSVDEVLPDLPEIEEDTDTFAGNAIKKAVITAYHTKELCLADDSGLEVMALGLAPGVYSARFAGPQKDDDANNQKVLDLLKDKNDRTARFVSYIAVADKSGLIGLCHGEVYGVICDRPKGKNGFGYDPIFIPNGYDKTFAQLSKKVKNSISHRKMALEKAKQILKTYELSLPL